MTVLDDLHPKADEILLANLQSKGFNVHYTWSNTDIDSPDIINMVNWLQEDGYETEVLPFDGKILVLKKSSLPQTGESIEKILQDNTIGWLPNFAGSYNFGEELRIIINYDVNLGTLNVKVNNLVFRLKKITILSLDGHKLRLVFSPEINPLIELVIDGHGDDLQCPLEFTLSFNGSTIKDSKGQPILGVKNS